MADRTVSQPGGVRVGTALAMSRRTARARRPVWIAIRSPFCSPLAAKELRGRMRGPRAFVVASVYLALLGLMALGLYAILSASVRGTATTGAPLGKLFFAAVTALELGLICALAPALTADLISGERERRTYDLLLVTPLTRGQIVVGKLVSALGSLLILIALGLPLQAIAIVLGGIGGEELLVAFVLLVLTAVTYGCAGLFWSARLRTTRAAVALAYGTTALGVLGLPAAAVLALVAAQVAGGSALAVPLQILSGRASFEGPVAAQVVATLGEVAVATNPLLTGILSAYTLSEGHGALFSQRFGGQDVLLLAPWMLFSLIHALAILALTLAAARALRPRVPR